MEFELLTDLNMLPTAIEFNFETLKNSVSNQMEFYKSIVVTEDSIPEAKSSRAELNKLKTAIEDKRKDVKKRINEPYTAFEKQVKEITACIDSAILSIDTQVKAFDDNAIAQKHNRITDYFNQKVGELNGIISLEKVLNPKWKNKSVSIDEITKEIDSKLSKIKSDLKILETMCKNNTFYDTLRSKYIDTLDMSSALAELKRLQEQKALFEKAEAELKRLQEQKALFEKAEAEKLKKSAEQPQKAIEKAPIAEPVTEAPAMESPVKPENDPVLRLTFKVTAPKSKLIELKKFLNEGGYIYE